MSTEQFIRLLAEDLHPKPDHPVTMLSRWIWAAAGLAGTAFLLVVGIRPDLIGPGAGPTLMKLLLGGSLAWAATGGAKILARPEAAPVEAVRGLGIVAAFITALFALDMLASGADGWSVRMFGKSITACLTIIPALALAPLAASLYVMRGAATTSATAAGGLLGFASAGMAILAYGLFCTEDSPVFVATWYSLAALIAAVVGAALGRILLRW